MNAPTNDIHDSLFDEIDGRITTLRAGAPASDLDTGARTQREIDTELGRLEGDLELLLAHWKTRNGLVAADSPVRARACGQPQPCPHVLELAQKYRFI